MPIEDIAQESFVAGEIGKYMGGRVSLPIYSRSASTLENVVVLPQGPVDRRRAFGYLYEFTGGVSADAINLENFSFNAEQEYQLAFLPSYILIFRNGVYKAQVSSPYTASDINDIRVEDGGDTMLITHASYAPRQLVRNGSDTDWSLTPVTFLNVPYMRYNFVSLCTPSGTSGSITLTLDQAPGWQAGHAQNGKIKINSGIAEITGFTQAATGGTALSSAGTAANAFDNNAATKTAAGTNGWIGYTFTGSTTVRLVGIKSDTTMTTTIVYETDSGPTFATATNRGTVTVDLTAGTTIWFNVTSPSADTNFRFRVTSGQALDVQDVYFATGLVASATVTTNLTNTTQSNNWSEWAWSPARGYPRTLSYWQNRLLFGGTRDAPASIFGSKTNDLFNFDNSATNADNAYVFTINSNQSVVIRNIIPKRNMNIFTGDGEFEMTSGDAAVTPTSVKVLAQSNYGISDIPVIDADNQLHFIPRNYKEVRSFVYQLNSDQYVADNKTIFAHHLFTDGSEPWGMAYIRSYRDTQANLVIVSKEDGEIACLTIDNDKGVLAWTRWITDGIFRDVLTSTVNQDGKIKQALFAVVKRTVNGVDRVFLEQWTEDDIYVDSFVKGSNNTPQTTWNGVGHLANSDVRVVADGLVDNIYTVNGSGQLVLDNAASEIVVGREYTTTIKPQPLKVIKNGAPVRGRQMRKVRAIVDVIDTLSLTIDDQAVPFREFGNNLLDAPLVPFTGTKERRLRGVGKDISLTLTVTEPLACTVQGLTTQVKISR